MVVVVIILAIMFAVSLIVNVLLISSKHILEKQVKQAKKNIRELKSENDEIRNVNTKLDDKIKFFINKIKFSGERNSEITKVQTELQQGKKGNARLTSEYESIENSNIELIARDKENEVVVPIYNIPNVQLEKLEETVKEQKNRIESLIAELELTNNNYKYLSQKYEKSQNFCEELKCQIAGYQTRLINTQKQIADLTDKTNLLVSDKLDLERKNNQLNQQIQQATNPDKFLLTQVTQLNCNNQSLLADLAKAKKQIEKNDSTIRELKTEISNLVKQIFEKNKQESKLEYRTSEETNKETCFPEDSEVILFKDGEYKDTLKRISDISVITEFLQNSSSEKTQRYLRQVKLYVEEISDLEDAFSRLDTDEDEKSSECINKFSKIFNEYIAENVIEPIYEVKDEDEVYEGLLESIIKYITSCGIYTKNVTVGNKYEKINYMDVIPEDTEDLSQHKIISKILRLPFYAKYTSETGKVREKLLSKGRCVVLKAKKEKQ